MLIEDVRSLLTVEVIVIVRYRKEVEIKPVNRR